MSERESLAAARVGAFDKGDCGNGPDEYGNWPCDPQVLLGGGYAECRVCGRTAEWGGRKAAGRERPAHLSDCDGVWPCSCVTRVEGVVPTAAMVTEMGL